MLEAAHSVCAATIFAGRCRVFSIISFPDFCFLSSLVLIFEIKVLMDFRFSCIFSFVSSKIALIDYNTRFECKQITTLGIEFNKLSKENIDIWFYK